MPAVANIVHGTMTRRQLLNILVHSLWVGGIGVFGVWRLTLKTWQIRRRTRKVRVGTLDQLTAASDGVTIQLADERYFLRLYGQQHVEALSLRCTHGDCTVQYDAALSHFVCPCHGGIFDLQGNVLAGPPRRALVKVPIRIEGNAIYLLDRSS